GVRPVNVTWSRQGSGCTLLFGRLILPMAATRPVKAIAGLGGKDDTKLWRVVHHYVDKARGHRDDSAVRAVGIDDKSIRRGHDYVTVFADLDERKVLFVADGRKGEAIEEFRWDLIDHGGDPDQIEEVCMDMSAAYIAGAET